MIPFFCCSSNVLKSVVDVSIDNLPKLDLSLNIVTDISNIQIHLDISNNERIVSLFDISNNGIQSVLSIINESNTISETISDISNNLNHILNIKEEFLTIALQDEVKQAGEVKLQEQSESSI
jgi:hypothetical protein